MQVGCGLTTSMFEAAAVLLWSVFLLLLLLTSVLALAQPAIRRRRLAIVAPPVTIIVPTRDEEPGFADALESVLRQMRAQDELIVSCAEPDGSSLPIARSCFARYPAARTSIYVGSIPLVRSPKMNNLLGPIASARNDLVLCKDANAILSDGQVVDLVRHLTPGVGLVTAAPRAAAPGSFAARIEAAIMNGYHARLLLAASALGGGFGLGKVMLFSRDAFNAAGGAVAMADAVHEDNAMGKMFARANLRTVIAGGSVIQNLGQRDLAAVWQRHLRWMVCRRFDAPLSLLLEPCATALVAMLLALAVAGPPLALFTFGIWYLVESLFLLAKGWPLVSLPEFLARELLLAAMWLRAWTSDDVVWSGERMSARRVSSGRRTWKWT